uniref:Sulfotransferase n=1 Tax=Callorhinchus milii TaxID=7868 RepID=V9L1W0_CALMI
MDSSMRCGMTRVEGVCMLEPFAHIWSRVCAFQAFSDDLLIATYPKAGTTWTQEIVDLINNDGDVALSQRAPTHLRIPFLDIPKIADLPQFPSGLELLEKMASPRTIKTHLPFQLIPPSFWDQNCKVIYVARNGKDNAVSYFHFDRMNLLQPEPGTWSQYLTRFMEGNVPWGSWFDHVKRFWDERENHRILYLFYEDMKEDPRREILKIVEFMDKKLDDEVIDNIVDRTSFNTMKDNKMSNYTTFPATIFNHEISPFMRKGTVGDWKNYFTINQNKLFDSRYKLEMENTSLQFRTEI